MGRSKWDLWIFRGKDISTRFFGRRILTSPFLSLINARRGGRNNFRFFNPLLKKVNFSLSRTCRLRVLQGLQPAPYYTAYFSASKLIILLSIQMCTNYSEITF